MDALKKAENWLRKISEDNLDEDPKFERFLQLIRSHDEEVKARKWMSAHDEIEAAFGQFVELTNQIMTTAKQKLEMRDKKEKPVYDLLEGQRSQLRQISKSAQAIAENAEAMLDAIDRSSKH